MNDDKMPLIIENPLPDLNEMDDLFGEGVNLALPAQTEDRQIHQRLDALRNPGCCQSIAWSRSGTIASIKAGGLEIEFRFLRCSPKDGSWNLSEPTPYQGITGTKTIPLVHLDWAGTSASELAVLDAAGRVSLLSFSISLNHPYVIRRWDNNDLIDSLNLVVGSHWLPVAPTTQQQKAYNVMYGPATRNENGKGFQYDSSFVHALGPSHPHLGKSALFMVTTGGNLRMMWSQNNTKVEETTMEIESISASEDLVTHAAFASDKKFLLVALTTASKQLKLFKIDIQWGVSSTGSQSDKSQLQQAARLNPSLHDTHLASTTWFQSGLHETLNDASSPELSHLSVLPSVMDNTGKNTVPPVIVAIRSRTSQAGLYQDSQSIIDRWEAVEERHNLHPAFEQLGSRRNSITSDLPTGTRLRKLEPVIINKVALGLHPMQFGKVLVLAFADGSVEYRDRFTFEELYTTEETEKIMALRQVGWTFGDDGPCQQVAFSPTFCSLVQMGDGGKVRWNKLQYPAGDIGNSMQEANYSSTIAALTVTAAGAVWYQCNVDDLLAIAKPFATKHQFTPDWISEIIKILKIQVDYSEEVHHDSLMRNNALQTCLSIMNSLGFRGVLKPRSFQSKYAMLDLNMRNVVILVTLASNTPTTVREKLSPLDEPEVVEVLTSCVKWSLNLLAWLVDCLFGLMNDEEFMARLVAPRMAELSTYLRDRNDVSLHLLLCSSSRNFLSALCRRITHLENLSTRALEFYKRQAAGDGAAPAKPENQQQLQSAYQRMQKETRSTLIKVPEFEKLLNTLGQDIKRAYEAFLPNVVKKQPNPPQGKQIDVAVKTARIQLEVGMLLSTSPPPAFVQIISKFFKQDLAAFRNELDPAELFFASYDLLEVEDDPRSLAMKGANGMNVDVLRRAELKRASSRLQWRRCARCAAVMEDVFGGRPGFAFILSQQRKCSCSGNWALLPMDKLLL